MTVSWFNPLLLLSSWLALFSYFVSANSTFNWTFINLSQGVLEECGNAQISVSTDPNNPPVGPYYLFAYEESGTTTVANLGSNVANLSWQVDHPSGTNLLISIIDSKGNSGGVAPQAFFVLSTTDSSCHSFEAPTVSVITNLTSTVETCSPIDFTISGGKKPYTGSIAITGQPSVLNFTMGPEDDTLIWYNRAPPAQTFVVSFSDAKGQYALSTQSGVSSGSQNVDCGSLPAAVEFSSSGGPSSSFPKPTATGGLPSSVTAGSSTTTSSTSTSTPTPTSNQPNGALAKAGKKSNAAAIAGGLLGGAVLLALLLLVYYRYLRSRRKLVARLDDTPTDLATDTPQMGITPFVPPIASIDGSSTPRIAQPGGTSVTNLSSARSAKGGVFNQGSVALGTQELASGSPSSETSQSTQALQAQSAVRQHVDIADVVPEAVDLPPAYSDRRPLPGTSTQGEEARPRLAVSNK